ncbi:response regulator [Membranihabitans maritimus]|uniref:response regulator n=1 Tax=Membranihabitans maritimus TaxID=2904244 RepID=UPI001F16B485|nr:response regulator transcription factor [Membranihabitans maritimus]
MINILIVDDHPLILEGLQNLLEGNNEVKILHTCSNAIEAMAAIKEELPDVALLDINLPDINGIELCKKIKEEFPGVLTVALTTFSERSYINKMIEAGASGYLLKSSTKDEIVNGVKQVYNGGMYLNVPTNSSSIHLDERPPAPMLTPREKEVLNLIAKGFTNPQIAEKLFVSVLTVNSHRKNLLGKFEVSNTAKLIKLAVEMGLVD